MSFKKLGFLALVAFVSISSSACHSVAPDAGEEAVLIQKPMLFGSGGVVSTPVKTGRTYVALTTQEVYVNVQPQQFAIHFEDMMSSDGVPLDFDAVVRLQITNSVMMIEKFGVDWFNRNVQAELANRVRQAVRKHGMNETAIDTRAIEEIDEEVTESLGAYLLEAGLPVRLIAFTVGKANPPDAVKNQRIATATEQQRLMTEQQRKLAEDARLDAEKSKALADNAYRNMMNLSPAQFLTLETIKRDLEEIKMKREVCAPGKCTFIIGASTAPTISVGG